jgi:hypothetical protein
MKRMRTAFDDAAAEAENDLVDDLQLRVRSADDAKQPRLRDS